MQHANNFTFNTDSSLGLIKAPSIVHCGVLAPLCRNCSHQKVEKDGKHINKRTTLLPVKTLISYKKVA